LRSPGNLERLAQQHNLGLDRPAPEQVIWLPEPGLLPSSSAEVSSGQYAANRGGEAWPR
jgi:hypothetical protein